jgi:hypothetical protein
LGAPPFFNGGGHTFCPPPIFLGQPRLASHSSDRLGRANASVIANDNSGDDDDNAEDDNGSDDNNNAGPGTSPPPGSPPPGTSNASGGIEAALGNVTPHASHLNQGTSQCPPPLRKPTNEEEAIPSNHAKSSWMAYKL